MPARSVGLDDGAAYTLTLARAKLLLPGEVGLNQGAWVGLNWPDLNRCRLVLLAGTKIILLTQKRVIRLDLNCRHGMGDTKTYIQGAKGV